MNQENKFENWKKINEANNLCTQAWTAFHLNDITRANRLCNKLIDVIDKESRTPTKREQALINTLNEISN